MGDLLRTVAGSLLVVGAVQFVVGMMLAEALYSGYSVRDNYISDLGVGPSAFVFNSSVFLFGLLVVVGAYFIWRALGGRLVPALLFISGIGAMGVGVFTEHARVIHGIAALIAFLFGAISPIAVFRLVKRPLNYIFMVMGVIALVSLVLFVTDNFLGLGGGGMERMIAYPMVLWIIAFGGHMIASEDKTS